MKTILPKTAYEAYLDLLEIEKKVDSYKSKSDEIFGNNKIYLSGKNIEVASYIDLLLSVVYYSFSDTNMTRILAVELITGSNKVETGVTPEEKQYIYSVCPAIVYNSFSYQQDNEEDILKDVYNDIQILVEFTEQIGSSASHESEYNKIHELYISSLRPYSKVKNDTSVFDGSRVDEILLQLDSMTGLDEVKKEVKAMVDLIKVRQLREQNGMKNPDMSLHMVFMGNPGTGKTTVARMIAEIYKELGVLSKGQLIETDRSGLVAGYVGQTALKVQEVVQSAIGGVLFIDEAYSLSYGNEVDFGREAIDTLLKLMEDNRDDLIVIVAGYSEPMGQFLKTNPGLTSRFNKKIYFPDYSSKELLSIFETMCDKNGYLCPNETIAVVENQLNDMVNNKGDNFGNGRDVRNYFENAISKQASRVARMKSPRNSDIQQLLPEDFDKTITISEDPYQSEFETILKEEKTVSYLNESSGPLSRFSTN